MKPILVVEDEAIMRDSLRDWLTDEGYPVETAEHGEEALKAIGKQDFSLLILDVRLPGKNGLEVLREAKAQRPKINGIIITAYPSVETAVEAMKLGVVDYLTKPFSLDALEKLIQQTLGPIQLEIKPKAAPKEAPPAEEPKVEEIIAIAPEKIPLHLKQGKEYFDAGRFAEALKEFESILAIAPANIETRVWIRKTKQVLAEPRIEGVTGAEEAKPKECLWMKMGLVAYRICTRDYDCLTCEFDQTMQEKMASGETPELDQALERFRELPGSQRLCRYAIKGDVSHRICSRLFQCSICEFGQMMEDALQQKLAKLQARREALLKKEQKAKA
jgi:CheY-like chemotaxis protein